MIKCPHTFWDLLRPLIPVKVNCNATAYKHLCLQLFDHELGKNHILVYQVSTYLWTYSVITISNKYILFFMWVMKESLIIFLITHPCPSALVHSQHDDNHKCHEEAVQS